MNDWEKWYDGMPIYITSKGETTGEEVEECPVCHGTGMAKVPFEPNLYHKCPGLIFPYENKFPCKDGQLHKIIQGYKVKERILKSFSIKYPQEKLWTITTYDKTGKGESSETYNPSTNKIFDNEEDALAYCRKMNGD